MKLSDLLDGLKTLTHARTAPYQELEGTLAVHEWLKKLKIQVETDNYGNTIARAPIAAYTVPANETRVMLKKPYFMAREVLAFAWYFTRLDA